MINNLTDVQWRRVYAERERWRAIGTCTDPADRETAEDVVRDFYRRIGEEPPRFVWLGGPASCVVASVLLRGRLGGHVDDQPRDQIRERIREQIGERLGGQLRSRLLDQLVEQILGQTGELIPDPLGGQLRDQLCGQLRGQLCEQVGDQIQVEIWDQVWDPLSYQLWEQLWYQLWDQIGDQPQDLQDELAARVWGQEWAYCVGHYAACRDAAGVTYSRDTGELLRQWERLVSSTGWWWPYRGVCLMAERPEHLSWDAEHRLHCEDGPAMRHRDGYELYAWHGTRVPAAWILDRDSLDPQTAIQWENVEQRRAAAEILGWDRILRDLDPVLVDRDPDPMIGELLRVDLPDSPGTQFLRVRCGTGRTFVLPVPPEMRTAADATAWTYGLEPDEYQLEART